MALLRRPIQKLLPDELWSIVRAQSRPTLTHHVAIPKPPMSSPFSTSHPILTSTAPNGPSTTSVDPTELTHFSRLASTWWDPHGPSRLLHLMNPLRHTFITSCLTSAPSPPSPTLHYLDIGCGGGIFAETAARLAHTGSVTAIDPSPDVLAVAKQHARQDPVLLEPGRLTYLNCAIEDLASREECRKEGYDILTIFEVLEHVAHPSRFLEDCLRHVKPGGWIVLSTIARTWTSWVVTKLVAEDVLGLVPRGTHEWGKYVNERELREWFGKREGWTGARSVGVVYVPGFGWREVKGGEEWGNYFFGVRKEL